MIVKFEPLSDLTAMELFRVMKHTDGQDFTRPYGVQMSIAEWDEFPSDLKRHFRITEAPAWYGAAPDWQMGEMVL